MKTLNMKFLFIFFGFNLMIIVENVDSRCPPITAFSQGINMTSSNISQYQNKIIFLEYEIIKREKRSCKITCVKNKWVGPKCRTVQKKKRSVAKRESCDVPPSSKDTIVTLRDRPIQVYRGLPLASGTKIEARCETVGRFKMIGDPIRTCLKGNWNGTSPTCVSTSSMFNYTDTMPPTIVWEIAGGSGAVSTDGTLVLLPKTILHLDCLFPRLIGNPSWTWSTSLFRRYPTGWSIGNEDKNLKYRVSIYYAKPSDDDGVFTCTSPMEFTNSIRIKVQDISCPSIKGNSILKIEGSSNKLNSTKVFSCPEGYILTGPSTVICLPSGSWSHVLPRCAVVQCPSIKLKNRTNLRLEREEAFFGGRGVFKCSKSYKLIGNETIRCQSDGTWSSDLPYCKEILCDPPTAIENGDISDSSDGYYPVGGAVVFSCKEGFVLKGHVILFCNNQGHWNHPKPECVASCEFPGNPKHGRISPRRSKYDVSTVVLVFCKPGYRPAGPDRLTCLQIRRWSSPVPPCVMSLG